MMRSLGLMLACGLGLLHSFGQAGEQAKPFEQSANEIKVFEMTNAERKKKNIAPLTMTPSLSKLARAHSENMAKQMKFEHKLDDKTPFDRMRDAGYQYQNAGENIAQGDENAHLDLIMKSWMDSKNHRANILHADYTEIGVGIARDKTGQVYYTQVFGRPLKK